MPAFVRILKNAADRRGTGSGPSLASIAAAAPGTSSGDVKRPPLFHGVDVGPPRTRLDTYRVCREGKALG
jgi:hypothetical protein